MGYAGKGSNKAFESCLKTIDENIETNKILIENYFSSLSGIFYNDTEIIEFLKTFEKDEGHLPYYLYYWSHDHYVYFTSFKEFSMTCSISPSSIR